MLIDKQEIKDKITHKIIHTANYVRIPGYESQVEALPTLEAIIDWLATIPKERTQQYAACLQLIEVAHMISITGPTQFAEWAEKQPLEDEFFKEIVIRDCASIRKEMRWNLSQDAKEEAQSLAFRIVEEQPEYQQLLANWVLSLLA